MTKSKIIWLSLSLVFLGLTVYYFYPEDKLPINTKIDKLVVFKSKRQLLAYSNGQLVKTYKISLGRHPIGDKEFEGDKKLLKDFTSLMPKIRIAATIKT